MLVIKTGSAFLIDQAGQVRGDSLGRVTSELQFMRERGWSIVWVASGAIARGKAVLGFDQSKEFTDVDLQAISAVGQGMLYFDISKAMDRRDLPAAQILLTFSEVTNRESYNRARNCFASLLDWGVIPVVNENDSVTTEGVSFGNNDFLAAQLAALLQAEHLILLTSVAGVFQEDPKRNPRAEMIRVIEDVNDVLGEGSDVRVGDRPSAQGSGGMRSKLRAAELAALRGIPVSMGNLGSGSIMDYVERRATCTYVMPRAVHHSNRASFKQWLTHGKPSQGEVIVDAGAVSALLKGGASLLLVGVTGAEGSFAAGDAVNVIDGETGRGIAKGITQYGAGELQLLAAAAELTEGAGRRQTEVIHRDEMVVFERARGDS